MLHSTSTISRGFNVLSTDIEYSSISAGNTTSSITNTVASIFTGNTTSSITNKVASISAGNTTSSITNKVASIFTKNKVKYQESPYKLKYLDIGELFLSRTGFEDTYKHPDRDSYFGVQTTIILNTILTNDTDKALLLINQYKQTYDRFENANNIKLKSKRRKFGK